MPEALESSTHQLMSTRSVRFSPPQRSPAEPTAQVEHKPQARKTSYRYYFAVLSLDRRSQIPSGCHQYSGRLRSTILVPQDVYQLCSSNNRNRRREVSQWRWKSGQSYWWRGVRRGTQGGLLQAVQQPQAKVARNYIPMRNERKTRSVMGWVLSFQLKEPACGLSITYEWWKLYR